MHPFHFGRKLNFLGNFLHLVCPGVHFPAEQAQNTSPSKGVQDVQMPEPLQLAPFDVEEQGLYSEPISDAQASHS